MDNEKIEVGTAVRFVWDKFSEGATIHQVISHEHRYVIRYPKSAVDYYVSRDTFEVVKPKHKKES